MGKNRDGKEVGKKKNLIQELWIELRKGDLQIVDWLYVLQHIEALRRKAWRMLKEQNFLSDYDLLLVMRIAQDSNCIWLLKEAWQVLKNNDPKKDIVIYVAYHIENKKAKEEAREILEEMNPTEKDLECLNTLKHVGRDTRMIKLGRKTILTKFKKLYVE